MEGQERINEEEILDDLEWLEEILNQDFDVSAQSNVQNDIFRLAMNDNGKTTFLVSFL